MFRKRRSFSDHNELQKVRRDLQNMKRENSKMKLKIKALTSAMHQMAQASGMNDIKDILVSHGDSYDDIGRDYLLIGGPRDPFAMRYEVLIRDTNGVQHKSAERYFWYKMAEFFGDFGAMQKIHLALDGRVAELAKNSIRNFDQRSWDQVKLKFWEEAQTLKLDQEAKNKFQELKPVWRKVIVDKNRFKWRGGGRPMNGKRRSGEPLDSQFSKNAHIGESRIHPDWATLSTPMARPHMSFDATSSFSNGYDLKNRFL